MAMTPANAKGFRKERKTQKPTTRAPTSKTKRNNTLTIEFGLFTRKPHRPFRHPGRPPMYAEGSRICNRAYLIQAAASGGSPLTQMALKRQTRFHCRKSAIAVEAGEGCLLLIKPARLINEISFGWCYFPDPAMKTVCAKTRVPPGLVILRGWTAPGTSRGTNVTMY